MGYTTDPDTDPRLSLGVCFVRLFGRGISERAVGGCRFVHGNGFGEDSDLSLGRRPGKDQGDEGRTGNESIETGRDVGNDAVGDRPGPL